MKLSKLNGIIKSTIYKFIYTIQTIMEANKQIKKTCKIIMHEYNYKIGNTHILN